MSKYRARLIISYLAGIHVDIRYKKIFVGREKDLETLSSLFDDCMSADRGPPHVYSYLNAPGIGKTTLIQQFGRMIEGKRLGIHLSFSCSQDYREISELVEDLYYNLEKSLRTKQDLIRELIDESDLSGSFASIEKEMIEIVESGDFRFRRIRLVLTRLSGLLPIFFSTDEIQQLQHVELLNSTSALSEYAQFLANLLPHNILLVISGMQYSIMSQIGHGIGSPLNEKIQSMVIGPLKSTDIDEYAFEFRKLYPEKEEVDHLWTYLQTFSGGHPRTIEKIVESYFSLGETKNFTENLTSKVDTLMGKTLLSSEKEEELRRMQSHEGYTEIKTWLLQGIDNNLRLNVDLNEERNNLIFELLTLGLIVLNGNSNYYITSYFHGLFFLKIQTEPYEQFLYEVLNNMYFRELVGGNPGLGFTFEKIIFTSLIIRGITSRNTIPEFDVSRLRRIELRWWTDPETIQDMVTQDDTLYHFPSMEGIDGLFGANSERILIQVTTTRSNSRLKLRKFKEMVGKFGTKDWFISLYRVPSDPSGIILTSGEDLADLLGESIYNRMLETKEFLSERS